MATLGTLITTQLKVLSTRAPVQPVVLNKTWEEKKVVLKVLRRFGCPLCRYEANELSKLKPVFDKLDVKMVAVGFDEPGLEEWLQGNYWNGELYLDKERVVYKYFDLLKVGAIKGMLGLFNSSTLQSTQQAKKDNLGGNLKGDGFQYGGTFVIDKGGKVLYAFKQENASSYPNLQEIVEAAGGKIDKNNLPNGGPPKRDAPQPKL